MLQHAVPAGDVNHPSRNREGAVVHAAFGPLSAVTRARQRSAAPLLVYAERVMLRLLLALCLCVGVLPAAQGDEAAVRALVDRYSAARDTANPHPDQIRALFTEDADQLVSSGEWRRGREALVPGMLRSSQTNTGDRSITVETVRLLSDDVALADARYVIGERNMWSAFLAVRTADGWRIAAIRNMKPAE